MEGGRKGRIYTGSEIGLIEEQELYIKEKGGNGDP
jgi:hypothetical protein